ncbi:MAG: cytochrome c biogenesis protein ResB [Dehalococcoidales bacterium]|nr:cytochrome c biogenesis protein ResB [Dehalococcoidales bacterium]
MAKTVNNSNNNQAQSLFEKTITQVWRLFSSAKLAIALILIITALSIIGIFTSAELFSSWYFITAGTLLMLNILICNINRWKGIQKYLKGSRIKQSEDFFIGQDKTPEIIDISHDSTAVYEAVKSIFQKKHYRLRIENDADNTYIAADKNRFFILGTYLSHLSIILLVLAYIIGSTLGFHESDFIVVEEETKDVGYDTGLSLNLISFTDSYYDDGTPSDYRSEVILYKDGLEVTRTTIRVNYPLSYEGIRFYQSFFGPATAIEVTKDGATLFAGNIALYGSFASYGYYRNIGFIDIEESRLSLAIITPSFNTTDPMIPEGQLAVLAYKDGEELGVHLLQKMTPLEIDDVILTYLSDSQYSGFQVKNDPGNALVWIACSLFIIGLAMVFYFPHSQIWLLIKNTSPGHCRLFVRVMASKAFNNANALKELISTIENNINNDDKKHNREAPHG